ncbi:MAG: sulfur carrier protein ThiS adenylyltransferase ThiF [Deltaproteobacteria bacterium]|nr:sulfur carrier protein ThiS adenylyltransferase ThiF [Deltaproteobacteria bacterium]
MEKERYLRELYTRNPPESLDKLQNKVVGITGAGGLGSNIAISLLRAGVQRFIIADYDRVELSNLNRQYYFLDQVGMTKTAALHQNLLRINPYIQTTLHCTRITADNLTDLFAEAHLLIEAFDDPEMKAMAANRWLQSFPDRFIITGSGISGYGMNSTLDITVYGKLVICGDQKTQYTKEIGLTAPRIGLVAQMQANAALEILLDGKITY